MKCYICGQLGNVIVAKTAHFGKFEIRIKHNNRLCYGGCIDLVERFADIRKEFPDVFKLLVDNFPLLIKWNTNKNVDINKIFSSQDRILLSQLKNRGIIS